MTTINIEDNIAASKEDSLSDEKLKGPNSLPEILTAIKVTCQAKSPQI